MTLYRKWYDQEERSHYEPAEIDEVLIHAMKNLRLLPPRINRRAEYYDLAGLDPSDGPNPYIEALNMIDNLIGNLKAARRELQALRTHQHEWDTETDYCLVCGADGRA